MWLLTTRARPHLAAAALAACADTGMTSRGVVYVDGDEHGLYDELELPDNWDIHRADHAGLSQALRWCLATFPDEPHYGWLADDMQPRTYAWDRRLEQAAGDRCMSQANDLWVFPVHPAAVASGQEPSAGQCWAGPLIRTVGWWALPGTVQAGTDVAWAQIIWRLRRMRFQDDVTVEHLHWRRGLRPHDQLDTDMHDANGHTHTAQDLKLLARFLKSQDLRLAVQRVRMTLPHHTPRPATSQRVRAQ